MKIDVIRKKIDALRAQEAKILKGRQAYLDRVVKQLAAKGVTVAELAEHVGLGSKAGRGRKPRRGSAGKSGATDGRSKVSIKFKDGDGNTWTGRGKPPRWLVDFEKAGGKRASLAVA